MAGTYTGWSVSVGAAFSPSTVVAISAAGQVSSAGAPCITVGTIRPLTIGKNLYDISLGVAGVGCPPAATSVNGVAYYDDVAGSLVALVLNGKGSDGTVFAGSE